MRVDEALVVLSLASPRLQARSYAHACELLEGWKAGPLKIAFRAAVRAAHPDCGGDGDVQRVTEARGLLRGLEIRPPNPRPFVDFSEAGARAARSLHGVSVSFSEIATLFEALRRAQAREREKPREGPSVRRHVKPKPSED